MNIIKKIKQINSKNIKASSAFISMGATGVFFSPIFSVFIGISLPFLITELMIKYNLDKNEINPIKFSLLSSVYKSRFLKHINSYIDESNDDLEKKYKLIISSFVLKNFSIEPETVIPKVSAQTFSWMVNFNLKEEIFTTNFQYNDYYQIMEEDFKTKSNLESAQKIYKDFSHLGILGSTVINLFNVTNNIKFLVQLQTYKLNETDIEIVKKETSRILKMHDDQKRLWQKISGTPEEDFVLCIMENNLNYHQELSNFYQAVFTKNEMCSDKALMDKISNINHIKKISNQSRKPFI